MKALLNKKKAAFRSIDREELRNVQQDMRVNLRECKDRRKLETKLKQNNAREVCLGLG